MTQCPVCGQENPPEAANCQTCQLATSLFEPVREAAGATASNSDYARAIAEILAVVGAEPEVVENGDDPGASAALSTQARFPPLTGPRTPAVAPTARAPIPNMPVLPAASGLSLSQHQVEELLQIGRREGLDVREADQTMLAALKAEDRGALETLRRSLFIQIAGAIAEDLEVQTSRRNELSPLVPTPSIDTELASAESAFASGDLTGAVRRLRQASDGLSALDERWATCQVLTAEADLMLETLRELGEDASAANGPLQEGRRLIRAGETERAERVLAGANRVLWGLLVPQLNESLQRIRTELHGRPATDAQIAPVVHELRQLAALIRRHNFGAAVTAYRRLRTAAAALAPPAAT